MVIERYAASASFMGQKVLMKVEWFGKQYFLLEDGDGVIYSAKVGEDGNPDFG